MIGRRAPGAPRTRARATTRSVLGGVGAGAALALAAPLVTPPPFPPDDPVARTVPLRPVGTSSAGTATVPGSGAGTGDTPVADGVSVAGAAFAAAPPDPGGPAAAARAAAGAYRPPAPMPVPAPAPASASAPRSGEPVAPRPSPRPGGLAGEAAAVVELTNAERARAGCRPLVVDRRITAAAQDHSEDMAATGRLSHDGSDGRGFAERISAAGHPAPGAENVAAGQPDAATVVRDWMASPGHRANILNCSLGTIGVGLADGYWTQDFGR